MKFSSWRSVALLSLVAVFAVSGCGQVKDKPVKVASAKKATKKVHDHSEWWCDEHGVPEAECSMCSAKVRAECKKKGDWCEEHQRAKSQCFLCDPSLEAKFAVRYEARYGKKPPVPEENRIKEAGK